ENWIMRDWGWATRALARAASAQFITLETVPRPARLRCSPKVMMKVLPNMKQCALLVSFRSSDEVSRVICALIFASTEHSTNLGCPPWVKALSCARSCAYAPKGRTIGGHWGVGQTPS